MNPTRHIENLQRDVAALKKEREEVWIPLLEAGEAWQRDEVNSDQPLGIRIAAAREVVK